MIYTDLTERALRLAYRAHAGQEDKAEVPYIFHPVSYTHLTLPTT